jgi:hypothetical protein
MRKEIGFILAAGLVAGSVLAGTITTDVTQRQVRDPRQLETVLDGNFAEIDNRTDGTTAMDIKTDDITASGAAADSLGINHTRASATGLYSTVTIAETVVLLSDTDIAVTELLTFNNDATQAVVGGAVHVVVDDNTDTTEDTSLEVYNYIGGSKTKVIDIGATTMAVPLIADVTSVTTDSGEGIDCQAAGTLPVGASTANKVEIADTGVETEIQGGLDVLQSVQFAYALKTANYTNTATDCVLTYDTSAATTNTLPEASTVPGKIFVICLQDDDGDLVVMTDGTDKFDGTNDILTFADAGDSCWLMATAANVYTILVNVGGTLSN